jgi:DNA-binding NarL/FixJ family response regulator
MKQPNFSIALADDFKPAQSALKQILTDAGYHISCIASSGKELINQLLQTSQPPKLCIIDVNMEPMNGFETCAAIKQIDPAIKVIAYTMSDDEVTKKKMSEAGADGFFVKGGAILLLLKTVKSFFEDDKAIRAIV